MIRKTMVTKIANIALLIWLLFFSLCILLTDVISVHHAPTWIFNVYKISYRYAHFVMFMLLLFTGFSFSRKAVLSLVIGVWTLGVMFLADILFASLYANIAKSGEPAIAWIAIFFFMKCIIIAVVFFLIAIVSYVFKKVEKHKMPLPVK